MALKKKRKQAEKKTGETKVSAGEEAYSMAICLFEFIKAKKLERQKEDFIAIASHELKTPVTSITDRPGTYQSYFECHQIFA